MQLCPIIFDTHCAYDTKIGDTFEEINMQITIFSPDVYHVIIIYTINNPHLNEAYKYQDVHFNGCLNIISA